MAVTLNASTSTGYIQTADTSGDLALQSNGTTQFTVSSTGAYGQLKSGTAVASTSGTSIDFTSIPSWVKRITVMFSGVSTSGTSPIGIQLGDAGGVETTSYVSTGQSLATGGTTATAPTNIFAMMASAGAATTYSGTAFISLLDSTTNTWVFTSSLTAGGSTVLTGTGLKALSATLTQVRVTTAGGTDTFDAGTINILYEG